MVEGRIGKRDFLRLFAVLGGAGVGALAVQPARAAASQPPFEQGKDHMYPRSYRVENGVAKYNYQDIDLGTLGPDVDQIFGFDFPGAIQTGARIVHEPTGQVLETRVVGVKRTDLETVQFGGVLGGDSFEVHRISDYGGDVELAAEVQKHAEKTAREHQRVVLIGDLGRFEDDFGAQERILLNLIIRAQRPARSDLGIPDPDFVNPRVY